MKFQESQLYQDVSVIEVQTKEFYYWNIWVPEI